MHSPRSSRFHQAPVSISKAPTYFIPVARFDELVDFLQQKIEATILGKRNRSRGHRNYETFDEFQLTQAAE